MKTQKRWLAALGMALGMALVSVRPAGATGANSDSVTVTISPLASYLLLVSTGSPTGGLSLGTVDALISTFTVNPTTVTVYSSYAQTGIELEGLLSGGMTLETNSANLATDSDKMSVWAVFSDTGLAAAPTAGGAAMPSANFQGTTVGTASSTIVTSAFVNVGGLTTLKYYVLPDSHANKKRMAGLPTNATDAGGSMSHLWLGLKMSPFGSVGSQQTLTVVLRGKAAF